MNAQDQKNQAPKPQAATLSLSQVTALVGIHRATLYRWMARADMRFPAPTIKAGRTVRWSRTVVDKWILDGVKPE
jgi:excisionase family DNA binding protein